MAVTTLKLWHDAALTSEITAGNPLDLSDGEALEIYAGSVDVDPEIFHERITLPGVNQLQVSIVDANTGAGAPDTDIKLALTEAGLAAATPGDPQDLGVELLGGVANALPVWVQYDDSIGTTAQYLDVTLKILDVQDGVL
jgi:hypothetical protein